MRNQEPEPRFYAKIGKGSPKPITPLVPCPACGGEGEFPCDECKGEGERECECYQGYTHDVENCGVEECALCADPPECEACEGNGTLPCEECEGKGGIRCEDCRGQSYVPYQETAGPNQMRAAMQERLDRSPRTSSYKVRDAQGKGFVVAGSGDARVFAYNAVEFARAVAVFSREQEP